MQIVSYLLHAQLRGTQQPHNLRHRHLGDPFGGQLAAALLAYLGQILGCDADLLGEERHLALACVGLQQRHKPAEDDIRLTDIGALLQRSRQIEFGVQHVQHFHRR